MKRYLEDHLPYRKSILDCWLNISSCQPPSEKVLRNCAFEAALIHCRVLLEFLGLASSQKPPLKLVQKHNYHSSDGVVHEVKISDLNGTFVELNELNDEEKYLLAKIYYTANKASAHLTYDSQHGLNSGDLERAIPIVFRLLKDHLH